MGFILKHHFPELALDIASLRRECESLSSSTSHLDENVTTVESIEASESILPADSPALEDENCTIDDVDANTVRTLSLSLGPFGTQLTAFCHITDYSGEFSHWNFSMHIKRNIDELMVKSNVPVRQKLRTWIFALLSHILTIHRKLATPTMCQILSALVNQIQARHQYRISLIFFHLVLWPLSWPRSSSSTLPAFTIM